MVTRKGNNVAKKLATKYPFGLRVSISKFWVFFFFISAWTVKSHEFTVQETKNHYSCTVAAMFMYVAALSMYLKILKMSHTALFTHLKIIATVFSVFSFQFQQQ